MADAQKRLLWPDLMKGIAIFLVALGHSARVDDALKYWIYTFHMPVFYFVSGYFMGLKNGSLGKTILRKAGSLLPVYFIFSFGGFAAESVLAGEIRWNRLMGIFFCQQGGRYDGFLYFFLGLFGMQCVLALLLKFCKKPVFVLAGCCILALGAFVWKWAGLPRWFWHLDMSFLLAPFAGLGLWLRTGEGRIQGLEGQKVRKWLVIGGLFLANVGLCAVNGQGTETHIDYNMLVTNGVFTCYGAGVAGVLWLFLLCRQLPEIKGLTFVGRNSALYYCFNWIGSRLSLDILPAVPMTLVAMLALWAVPVPFVLVINRWFPWVVGRKREKIHGKV